MGKKKKRSKRRQRGNQIQPQVPSKIPTILQVVQAQHNYTRQTREELSMVQGETLQLQEKIDKTWWRVTNSEGRTGLVPAASASLVPAIGKPAHASPVVNLSSPTTGQAGQFGGHRRVVHQVSKCTSADHTVREPTDTGDPTRSHERHERRKQKKQKKEKTKRLKAAVVLQARYRGYKVRAQAYDDDEEEDDRVESLVGHRMKDGKLQLKVRWLGSGPEDDEWFPMDSLRQEWPDLVERYCADARNKIHLLPR